MTIDDDSSQVTPESPNVAPEPPNQGLRRSTSKRMVAGVAGGIAERFDIDPVIVRVVFIVLSFLYGLGVAIYLVMWALVPRDTVGVRDVETADDGDESATTKRRMGFRAGLRTVILIAGAIVVGLIFSSIIFHGPRWGSGLGAVWLVFLVVLAVISLSRPSRGFSFGRLISGILLALLSLVIVGSGIFLGMVALTGVPMTGGIGEKLYQPTSLAEINSTYRIAFGQMTLDLRQVPFKGHTVTVTASVAVGNLEVDVPPGVVVDVSAQSGIPHISYPQGYSSFYIAPSPSKNQAHLILRARVGIGDLRLIRAAPGVDVQNW